MKNRLKRVRKRENEIENSRVKITERKWETESKI